MATKESLASTRYYRWDGRACRVHLDERGDLTADIHPAGGDEISISAADVIDGAVQIGQAEYERLIKWHDDHA